jgi:hypothetical protein
MNTICISSWWSGWPANPSAVGSGGFCLSPVIACLFFVPSVVYVGDASVFSYIDIDIPTKE